MKDSSVPLRARGYKDDVLRELQIDRRKATGKLGARYARVPSSSEACVFCLMLASRDFAYFSKDTAGDGTHYRNHCSCKVVTRTQGDKVERYDLDSAQDRYRRIVTT